MRKKCRLHTKYNKPQGIFPEAVLVKRFFEDFCFEVTDKPQELFLRLESGGSGVLQADNTLSHGDSIETDQEPGPSSETFQQQRSNTGNLQELEFNLSLNPQQVNPQRPPINQPAEQPSNMGQLEGEGNTNLATQQLSSLQNSNIFTQKNTDPSTASINSSALNHELISELMRGNQQESQSRICHGQLIDQVNHASSAGRILPASSGLANSITAFAKSMLGMTQSRSTFIPVPPTVEEYNIFSNYQTQSQQAITQFVNNYLAAARQAHGPVYSSSESRIRSTAIREAKKMLPEAQYDHLPSNARNSKYFAAKWLAHGHRSLARSGIPRCTYDWSENNDNQWKSTLIEVQTKVFLDINLLLEKQNQYNEALSVYSIDGMVSVAEGEDGKRESARSAAWCHSDIHHLDLLLNEAYVQLGNTPRIKRERHLNILNSRHPNLPEAAHEIAHENIPKEIPQNWVKPEYFSRLTDI
ncbi:hypothetical protein BY996DRAFT_6480936 [Phakopsora pachyrhizi]|nr:hypothetical protein BY996DRAFT_6480936 [Phakopsora pachyrhizi]